MIVTCDKCHKPIDILLKEEEKAVEGQNIIRTYMECPYCKKQYDISYDSQSTLVLKKQIRRKQYALGTIKDEKQYNRELRGISKRKNRLDREMKILQSKYRREN